MTQDEIIEMAREAGIGWLERAEGVSEFLTSFANLVAAKEREACAKVCDDLYAEDESVSVGECVAAIRARGEA